MTLFTVHTIRAVLSTLVLASVFLGGFSNAAQQRRVKAPTRSEHYVKHTFQLEDGTVIHYWLMTPPQIQEGKRYPLVLALHGSGGNTEAATTLGWDAFRNRFPCFVMAPAVDSSVSYWARPRGFPKRRRAVARERQAMLPAVLKAMEALIKAQPIDVDRVYVTGQSIGGVGTFGAVALRPDLFAAAVPVCGGWDPQDAQKTKHVPLRVFHGSDDRVVPTRYSRAMVEAIKKAGGSPKYTEYEGVAHNSWTKAYAETEMWDWLFAQRPSH